jgi:hypothetical protein
MSFLLSSTGGTYPATIKLIISAYQGLDLEIWKSISSLSESLMGSSYGFSNCIFDK